MFDGENVIDGYGERILDTGANRFSTPIQAVFSRRVSDGSIILRCFGQEREDVFSIRGVFVDSTRFDGEFISSSLSYPITLTKR
jgi:hypothetical protein